MPVVALRPVENSDLDALFDQMRDPASVLMAAFTAEDPDDRGAFDAHMAMVRSSPGITLRAVTCDGRLVGSISSFVQEGQTEVTYWIERAAWGAGIATRALLPRGVFSSESGFRHRLRLLPRAHWASLSAAATEW